MSQNFSSHLNSLPTAESYGFSKQSLESNILGTYGEQVRWFVDKIREGVISEGNKPTEIKLLRAHLLDKLLIQG